MSKVILCSGQRAKKPYTIRSSGIKIYSVEELCCYIGNNIDTLCEEDFGRDLATFFTNELLLPERGSFFEHLFNVKATFKDVVVAIICSCDYFDEAEAERLLDDFDVLIALPPSGRKKLRADKLMREGRFGDAMQEYRSIISDKKNTELTSAEYGNILHNIAVLQVKSGAFEQAAQSFLEAYERNGNAESLKQYLYALKLGHREDEFSLERARRVSNRQLDEEIENELAAVSSGQAQTLIFEELERLKELRSQGHMYEYDRLTDEIIDGLKKKYRQENFT